MKLNTVAVLSAWLLLLSAYASADEWQPAPGHTQTRLWPGEIPDRQAMPGPESSTLRGLVAGRPWLAVTNVSESTMTVYRPKGVDTGAAILVFPGGGFAMLAMDLEGTEPCDWLTSKGISCILVKYRVPSAPFDWHCKCRPDNLMVPTPSLQDAERATGLVRFHAKEWHIDPHKIGVLGFSAGGYLVAELSTRFDRRAYKHVDAADNESSRPDFVMAIYPGHIATNQNDLNKNILISSDTPTTFLLQAEDDEEDGVEQSQIYYNALKTAKVSVELHLYARGGHAFGLRKTRFPITDWPSIADVWLKTIGILPD